MLLLANRLVVVDGARPQPLMAANPICAFGNLRPAAPGAPTSLAAATPLADCRLYGNTKDGAVSGSHKLDAGEREQLLANCCPAAARGAGPSAEDMARAKGEAVIERMSGMEQFMGQMREADQKLHAAAAAEAAEAEGGGGDLAARPLASTELLAALENKLAEFGQAAESWREAVVSDAGAEALEAGFKRLSGAADETMDMARDVSGSMRCAGCRAAGPQQRALPVARGAHSSPGSPSQPQELCMPSTFCHPSCLTLRRHRRRCAVRCLAAAGSWCSRPKLPRAPRRRQSRRSRSRSGPGLFPGTFVPMICL